MKKCKTCGEWRDIDDFYKRSGRNDRSLHCKFCESSRSNKWAKDNPERARDRARKSSLAFKYGITPEIFDLVNTRQQGRCLICECESDKLEVDHDHTCCSGKKTCGKCLRGLLCGKCNKGISQFDEDIVKLKSAIAYIEYWNYSKNLKE